MVDDVRCNLNVPVKALQRVVCRRIAEPLLDVRHIPDSGAEGLRQTVDRRGQRRHLIRNPKVPSESCQQAPVLVVFLKMREIPLHIIDRLIAVFHPHAVHVLIELIVDAAEFLHGVLDLRVVQPRVFLVEFLNCRVPFLVAKSAALLHARMLRQIVPVELRFTQPLHRVALRNQISVFHLPAEIQRFDPVLQSDDVALSVALVLVHRVEILVVERLGLLIRNLAFFCNVPDVPLHGLAHIRKAAPLVDPLLGFRRVQRVLRLIAHPLLSVVVPCFQPQRQQIIVRFRFVGFQDRFRVLPVLYRFRRRVSTQQHIHDLLVCVRQKILALHLLEFLLLGLDLPGKLHRFLCRLRHAQLLLPALLRFLIAFRNADSLCKPLHGFIKVIPRPRLEALRLCAKRFVQRLFALPDALRHLIELQELVARRGDARREQLRRHLPHLLIERVHRKPLTGKAQRAERLLAEQVKVRNVRPVFRRDKKLLRADFLAHILVLLIVFRVGFPPGVPCLVKQLVQLLAVHLAAAQHIIDDLVRNGPQRLALGRLRYTQIVCQPPHQRIFRPRHIFRRPLRQYIPEPLLCRRKLHLTGIVSLWIPLLLKVPKHIFRKNTLVRAVDSLQKICYTNFGSLDRAHALGLCVRLAAIFLSSADRVQHVIGFNSGHAARFLLHCYDCSKLPPAAVRRIRSHRISTGNVLRLTFQCIDWNCIFDNVSDY